MKLKDGTQTRNFDTWLDAMKYIFEGYPLGGQVMLQGMLDATVQEQANVIGHTKKEDPKPKPDKVDPKDDPILAPPTGD